jgi:hypothetical protein
MNEKNSSAVATTATEQPDAIRIALACRAKVERLTAELKAAKAEFRAAKSAAAKAAAAAARAAMAGK